MAVERVSSINNGARVLEDLLGDEVRRNALIDGKEHKQAILQFAARILKHDRDGQVDFLNNIFKVMAKEGDPEPWTTDMREGAAGVLIDFGKEGKRLTKPFIPIIEANRSTVRDAYIDALKMQTKNNDPTTGSIAVLLDIGEVIAPYIRQDDMHAVEILQQWKRIEYRYRGDGRQFIHAGVGTVIGAIPKEVIADVKTRDSKVAPLRRKGLTDGETALWLGQDTEKIRCSNRRLLATGLIRSRKPTPEEAASYEAALIHLREKKESPRKIQEQIGGTRGQIKPLTSRLLKEGKIERIRATPEQMNLIDERVAQLRTDDPTITIDQIAEQENLHRRKVERSAFRSLAQGRIERRHALPKQVEKKKDRCDEVEGKGLGGIICDLTNQSLMI